MPKKQPCPNQQLIEYLRVKKDELESKSKGNDHLKMVFNKALKSLQKCPFPITSGQESKQLEGIGEFLAKIIDAGLQSFGQPAVDDLPPHTTALLPSKPPPAPKAPQPVVKLKVTRKVPRSDSQLSNLSTGSDSLAPPSAPAQDSAAAPQLKKLRVTPKVPIRDTANIVSSSTTAAPATQPASRQPLQRPDSQISTWSTGSAHTTTSACIDLTDVDIETLPLLERIQARKRQRGPPSSAAAPLTASITSTTTAPYAATAARVPSAASIISIEISDDDDEVGVTSRTSTTVMSVPPLLPSDFSSLVSAQPKPALCAAATKLASTGSNRSVRSVPNDSTNSMDAPATKVRRTETQRSVQSASQPSASQASASSLLLLPSQSLSNISAPPTSLLRRSDSQLSGHGIHTNRPLGPSAFAQEVITDWSRYDMVMLLDNRELGRHAHDRVWLLAQLQARGVTVEVRDLPLGDIAWVARHRTNQHREYMMDTLCERKTPADLASSITDGRYKEQRFRLKRSGIRTVFYLIEGDVRKDARCAELGLESALCTMQVRKSPNKCQHPQTQLTLHVLHSDSLQTVSLFTKRAPPKQPYPS
eukprot:TRINITY_DN1479_c0_g1_i2.p1 TRINITY_DN1479_c0_g1~~TRINITY_DN1479_c0_g1_i2.p1  ORF type:complete len:589 (+),score=105.43 TRINITY_DN1479_c0_g1_i2:99-1865(+)